MLARVGKLREAVCNLKSPPVEFPSLGNAAFYFREACALRRIACEEYAAKVLKRRLDSRGHIEVEAVLVPVAAPRVPEGKALVCFAHAYRLEAARTRRAKALKELLHVALYIEEIRL